LKDPLNNITTFTYEVGDLVKVKDPLNRETQRILDAAGRLRNITNPFGQKTLYTPLRGSCQIGLSRVWKARV
jgi:YD repeat-containing protein